MSEQNHGHDLAADTARCPRCGKAYQPQNVNASDYRVTYTGGHCCAGCWRQPSRQAAGPIEAALQVLVLTPHIRAYLVDHDIQALHQACRALKAAGLQHAPVDLPAAAPRLYEVVVGNVGTVYSGPDAQDALSTFNVYVEQSKADQGRAGGEDVTLMRDGEPVREYHGAFPAADGSDAGASE